MFRPLLPTRIGVSGLAALATLAVVPASSFATVLFTSNLGTQPLPSYSAPAGAVGNWPHSQTPYTSVAPAPAAVVGGQTRRLGIVANPGVTAVESNTRVLQAEVFKGDETDTGDVDRPRAEVYNQGTEASATNGQLRWYSFTLRLQDGFNSVTSDTLNRWTKLTQWKGRQPVDPPLALQVANGQLELARRVGYTTGSNCSTGGTCRTGPTCFTSDSPYCYMKLGDAPIEEWIRLAIGVRWSTSATGQICVLVNGAPVTNGLDGVPDSTGGSQDDSGCTPQTLQTLQRVGSSGNTPDPIYVKQGVYQNNTWKTVSNQNHKAWFGSMKIGEYLFDVDY